MDYSKHHVVAYMSSLENENFELTKELNHMEIEIVEMRKDAEQEIG